MRAPRPRARAWKRFQDQRLAHEGLADDEVVDIQIVVVLGIGDRAFEALLHIGGDALAGELEIGKRRLDLLPTNELRHEVQLRGETRSMRATALASFSGSARG